MMELAIALVEAQKEMPAVEADAVNPHFQSKFVSLDHLIAKTKPVLSKHGLAIVQLPSNIDGNPALTTTIIHAASGEFIKDTMPLVLEGQNMQKLGGALTYARRYAWAAALGICDETDDDGNQASAPGQASASGRTLGGAGGGTAAGSNPLPPGSPAAFTWPSGKHAGKNLADTPRDYIGWYASQGPKEDVRAICEAFLDAPAGEAAVEQELLAVGATEIDSDIPFLPTIDGLGN